MVRDNQMAGKTLPRHLVDAWKREYEQTPAAQALWKDAMAPVNRECTGEVPTRRGAFLWHQLPHTIAHLPCSYARKYASIRICQRLYSAFRGEWQEVDVTPPDWPERRWYGRDY